MEMALYDERKKHDPEVEHTPSIVPESEAKPKADTRRSRLENDEDYMEIVKHAQEGLKSQAGRTKSRTLLEKCLTEVTYLVNANPAITANRPAAMQEQTSEYNENGSLLRPASNMQPTRRPLSPDVVSFAESSAAHKSERQQNGTTDSTPLDEVALGDLEQIEKIQHIYDVNGNFISDSDRPEHGLQRDGESWTKMEDAWDFGDNEGDVAKTALARPPFSVTATMKGHVDTIFALDALLIDGDIWTASAGVESVIMVHLNTTPEPVVALKDHTGAVSSLLFDTDPTQQQTHALYSAGDDMVIRKWSLNFRELEGNEEELSPVATFVSHSQPITALAKGGAHLFSASKDGSVRMWSMQSTESVRVWWLPDDGTTETEHIHPSTLCILPESRIAAGYTNGQVRIYQVDTDAERPKRVIDYSQASCITDMLVIDGSLLVTAHRDSCIRTWNLAERQQTRTIPTRTAEITSLAASPLSNDLIASSSLDCTIRIWSLGTGECLQEVVDRRHSNEIEPEGGDGDGGGGGGGGDQGPGRESVKGIMHLKWFLGYLGDEYVLGAGANGVLQMSQRGA